MSYYQNQPPADGPPHPKGMATIESFSLLYIFYNFLFWSCMNFGFWLFYDKQVIHWKQEGIHPLATLHRDTLRRDTLHQATLHPATHLRDTLHNTHLNTLPHHHLNNNINTNPVAAVAWKAGMHRIYQISFCFCLYACIACLLYVCMNPSVV